MSVETLKKLSNKNKLVQKIGKCIQDFSAYIYTQKIVDDAVSKKWLTKYGKIELVCTFQNDIPKSILIKLNEKDVDESLCLKGLTTNFPIYK